MSDSENFNDAISSPTASITTIPVETKTRTKKKRKADDIDSTPGRIIQENLSKFKVLKKLNIQLTRTKHHIEYLERCNSTKSIPKSLRISLTPQVPIINSVLQIKWEDAHQKIGLELPSILLDYWKSRAAQLTQEITDVQSSLDSSTTPDQVDLIKDIISKITLSVRSRTKKITSPRTKSTSTINIYQK